MFLAGHSLGSSGLVIGTQLLKPLELPDATFLGTPYKLNRYTIHWHFGVQRLFGIIVYYDILDYWYCWGSRNPGLT